MANIKSAKKRVLIAEVRNARNKAIKSGVKTAVKKVEAAVAAGDKENAQKELLNATQSWSTPSSNSFSNPQIPETGCCRFLIW